MPREMQLGGYQKSTRAVGPRTRMRVLHSVSQVIDRRHRVVAGFVHRVALLAVVGECGSPALSSVTILNSISLAITDGEILSAVPSSRARRCRASQSCADVAAMIAV